MKQKWDRSKAASGPDVVVDDDGVAAAGRQRVLVPGQGADSRGVALERPDLLPPRRVPDLDRRRGGAHRDVLACAACGVELVSRVGLGF